MKCKAETEKLKACTGYFSTRSVYRKLFAGFRKKYESLGRFGGSVTLMDVTAEEREQLGGFLQRDYAAKERITVSAGLMEKALASSRFAGLSWEEILEAYFGETLTVKKELIREVKEEQNRFFEEVLAHCPQGAGREWLGSVLREQSGGWQLITRLYAESPGKLMEILRNVTDAIDQLPAFDSESGGTAELLAVFAAKVTGNPHSFDEGTAQEKLLMIFLESHFGEKDTDMLSPSEYRTKLLGRAGILRDELSNDVLVYGIRAWKRNGMLHEGIEGFLKNREPVKLSLRTIMDLSAVRGQGTDQKNPVYVMENPAVFAVFTESHPKCAAICGGGQIRLAVMMLMDALRYSSVFYYSGDYDPEGLQIAQRLKQRYGDGLRLWNYSEKLYEKYLSPVVLTDARLKKLENIYLKDLDVVKGAMLRRKRAAYQEAMIEVYQKKVPMIT
ncbi:MAG TPA: DUF2399 domain-containing protein [Candidatus Egerieimonas faecigallinarum]|nr:DUF2399 domain-containing protein [Candidatus Egerieimonas faecigallinarum]